jgi:S1-C subfamily serine protease
VHIGGTAFLGVQAVSAGAVPGYDYTGAGAVIAAVVPGGPAAGAGLVAGDVITALDGRKVSSPSSLASRILAKKPGATVSITYLDQDGTSSTVRVKLVSGPPQ